MLFIPKTQTKIGLVQKCKMKGKTRCSSFNFGLSRKENPINYDSDDRWCSGPTGEFEPEWWEVTFDHWIYPTNYSFASNDHFVPPKAWTVQGKKKDRTWVNISTVTKFHIENNKFTVIQIDYDAGPFRTFRFISNQNKLSDKTFHFCIFKIDFFGIAFKNFCPISIFKRSYYQFINILTLIPPFLT